MAEPNPFDALYDQDGLDRVNNTGKYERGPGYYYRANMREVLNSFRGNWNRADNAKDFGDVIEGLVPGGLSGLYSVADMASQAAQEYVGGQLASLVAPGTTPKAPVRLPGARTATRMYEESRQAASDYTGTEEIEGTGDVVFGVLPTLLAPSPKLDKAKTALGKVAQFGTAMVVPFSQSKIGSLSHLAEGALPLAVSEGAAYAADLPQNVYDSAIREEQKPVAPTKTPEQEAKEFHDMLYTHPEDISDMPGADTQDAWYATREAQFAAGTTAALVAARLATHGGRMSFLRGKPPPHPDQISGEVPVQNALDTKTHLAKATLDKTIALPDAVRKLGGTDEDIRNMEAVTSAAMNPVSQANMGTSGLQFGIMPGMQRRVESLGRIMSGVVKLGDDNANLYTRAMSALDMVSRLKPGQVITDAAGQAWDAARLNAIVHQARQNPQIAALMHRTRQWYDDMREVLQTNGVIDAAEAARWAKDNPHFVHTQINFKNMDDQLKQFVEGMLGTEHKGPIPDSAVIRSLTQRSADPQHGVLPGQGTNLLETMEKYGQSVVRAVLENNNKKYFFKEIERLSNGTGGGIVKQVNGPGDDTISFFDNGTQKHYKIYDSALHSSLLNQPALVVPVLNSARSLVHFWATGGGNPAFVWSSAMFDTALSPLMRMNGNSLGPMDELVRRATGGKHDVSNAWWNPLKIDPSAIANWPVGSTRFLYGAFIKEMGERLDASIAANTGFARSLNALGLPADAVLKVIDDAYMRSMHFLWNNVGGGANAATLATPEALRASIAQTAPAVVGYLHRMDTAPANPMIATRRAMAGITATTAWRSYTALMNALHSGVKFQHFAANAVPVKGHTAKQARLHAIRAGKSSRELTVDPSRTGDSTAYRTYASSALWGNVGVQSLYQLGRAIADHPTRLALTTSAMGMAAFGWLNNLMGGDPEMAQYYYNTLTPTQRVQLGIPMYKDENGEIQYLPVDPTLRPVIAVMTELYGAMAGHTAEMPRDDEQQGMFTRAVNDLFGAGITEAQDDNIWAGFSTGVTNALPGLDVPVLNYAMREMGGMTPQNSAIASIMQRGEMYTPEKDSAISPTDERSVNAIMPKFIENVLTEALGTVGRRMVDATNTFGRVIKADGSPLVAADAAFTQWQQSWKDAERGKPIQSFWTTHTNDRKVDTFNEIARRNRMSMDGIDKILKWGEKGLKGANATDAASPMGLEGTSIEVNKQQIAPLIIAVGEFKRSLQPIQESITDARAKLEDIEKSPLLALRPNEQRQKANELRLVILEQQNAIYDQIQSFEDSFSRNLGMPVRLHDFDPADWTDGNAIQQPAPLPRQQ